MRVNLAALLLVASTTLSIASPSPAMKGVGTRAEKEKAHHSHHTKGKPKTNANANAKAKVSGATVPKVAVAGPSAHPPKTKTSTPAKSSAAVPVPAGNNAQPASGRPNISYSPKQPFSTPPSPPARTKTCTIQSFSDPTKDDAPAILAAIKACNNGGHVVFTKGTTYTIATALDLTFLNSIDIDIQGTIKFTADTKYWQANAFKFIFQNAVSFWRFGGNDVFIYGGGTIDGNGQAWYDLYAKDIYILRPVLIGVDGLKNSIISDLVLRYSPQYYFFIANSKNVIIDHMDISGGSTNGNPAKNTDGYDTYRSSDIVIQNSKVNNGDDCVSFKPNSTNILVQNMDCTGSHGMSVGSLGQYKGQYDIVENVYVTNCAMHKSTQGARVKVWSNAQSALSGDLKGGGGTGRVNNIVFEDFTIDDCDYAMQVNQCYGQKDLALCLKNPSPLTITNVVFKGFKGKTTAKNSPEIGALACSNPSVCKSISSSGNTVTSPAGTKSVYCLNMDQKLLDVTCTTVFKGFG